MRFNEDDFDEYDDVDEDVEKLLKQYEIKNKAPVKVESRTEVELDKLEDRKENDRSKSRRGFSDRQLKIFDNQLWNPITKLLNVYKDSSPALKRFITISINNAAENTKNDLLLFIKNVVFGEVGLSGWARLKASTVERKKRNWSYPPTSTTMFKKLHKDKETKLAETIKFPKRYGNEARSRLLDRYATEDVMSSRSLRNSPTPLSFNNRWGELRDGVRVNVGVQNDRPYFSIEFTHLDFPGQLQYLGVALGRNFHYQKVYKAFIKSRMKYWLSEFIPEVNGVLDT